MLIETSFKIKGFNRYIRIFADSKEVLSRKTSEIVEDNGYHIVLVRGNSTKKNCQSILFVKDVAKLLLRLVELCRKENIMFRPEPKTTMSRLVPPAMTTDYIRKCYKEVRKDLTGLMTARMCGLKRATEI